MTRIFQLALVVVIFVTYGSGLEFPNNAVVCNTMIPVPKTVEPQSKPPPFVINVNKESYRAGDSLKVTIQSKTDKDIKGFMIAARAADKSQDQTGRNFGTFTTSEVSHEYICTSPFGSAMVHANSSNYQARKTISFNWASLISTKGHLVIRASIIYSDDEYWVGEPSKMIVDVTSAPPPRPVEPSAPPTADSVNTLECGKSKGCYRYPSGCTNDCDVLMTWSETKDYLEIQLTGDTEGWVAVAFSEDTRLGKDEVLECVWNETARQVEIRHLKTREDGKLAMLHPNLGVRSKIGWLNHRRVSCSFRRDKVVPSQKDQFNERRYLLLSKGKVDNKGRKLIHDQEAEKYPYVSPQMVKMSENLDLSDTIRYPLVKAHACLMVIGWMVCFLTAMLLSKYYRPMWPNERWCGKRVWYSGYMMGMILCMIFTIIAVILIVVHASGYAHYPSYPNKAHPPIGICVTILIILIPLFAICRPTEPNKQSPFGVCINWFLWLFETAAAFLGTINLFLGLSLPKAHVPWWTTWVVVAFFLFHLIVELMLEIHGCLNSRKQEFRKQEFEKQKKGALEPEPVGKQFKKRTLTIYLFVSVILGLVIVISIAAG